MATTPLNPAEIQEIFGDQLDREAPVSGTEVKPASAPAAK